MNTRVFIPVGKAEFYRFIAAEPEGRYEFEKGRIVQQMTGGTKCHQQIAQRIVLALLDQLEGQRWSVLPDRGVETAETIRFPDVVVEPADEPADSLATTRPAIVVEVLSPSSTARDLDRKPKEYLALPTLAAYIVASQTDAACLAWVRGPDGRFPPEPAEHGSGATIEIPAHGVRLDIDDIYRGLTLTSPDTPPHG